MTDSFKKAVAYVQGLPKDGPVKPDQNEQLEFYQWYKQATIGDVNVPRPGLLDFVGKAKWDAWNSVKGTSKEVAEQKYVDKLVEVLKKFPDNEDAKKLIAELTAQ
ncbi:acyl-CoA-binding protein [Hygrophoropsis aurantiaca]|uniref:Acyl-CoA-binding protein n=1 Tax=Hygrophoropsis aurantiaca TaxID=72124 RepID=A0ACB8AL90_9AGAM|nr:acyl-CoA-binding protein [Hygrophoropsis aurantiaca]